MFSFTVIVGVDGVKSTTSIVMSFVIDLVLPAFVTVTGISNAPATVGVPEIVLADSSYVTPSGSLVLSTVNVAPAGTANVIGRRPFLPSAII